MEDEEKSRKRQREQDQADANGELKSKARLAGGATVPSEEEIEEFFEILRRMHLAIRYFNEKINVHGERDGRFSGKLMKALETGLINTTSEGDHNNGHDPVEDAEAPAAEKNHIFDLNSEPDQEIVDELSVRNSKY